jgi:hypothetical protein
VASAFSTGGSARHPRPPLRAKSARYDSQEGACPEQRARRGAQARRGAPREDRRAGACCGWRARSVPCPGGPRTRRRTTRRAPSAEPSAGELERRLAGGRIVDGAAHVARDDRFVRQRRVELQGARVRRHAAAGGSARGVAAPECPEGGRGERPRALRGLPARRRRPWPAGGDPR